MLLSGPRFRKHRRFINQVFNQKGISAFRPLQEKEILVLLEGMLHHPDEFVDHFRRLVNVLIRTSITYDPTFIDMLPPQFLKLHTVMTYIQLTIYSCV